MPGQIPISRQHLFPLPPRRRFLLRQPLQPVNVVTEDQPVAVPQRAVGMRQLIRGQPKRGGGPFPALRVRGHRSRGAFHLRQAVRQRPDALGRANFLHRQGAQPVFRFAQPAQQLLRLIPLGRFIQGQGGVVECGGAALALRRSVPVRGRMRRHGRDARKDEKYRRRSGRPRTDSPGRKPTEMQTVSQQGTSPPLPHSMRGCPLFMTL